MDDDYLDLNRSSWDERAPAHAASPDYNLQGYVDDPAYIGHLVQFDRPLLGDLSGLRGCTCRAISAPTRSACPASAPA